MEERPPKRPRLLISSFDLEKQLRKLAESTLGAERGKWPYQGLKSGFPLLDERIDGVRNAVYVLASAARMGKSTFALQWAHDMLVKNPEALVLFVSLDQPARELNIRQVALAGECRTDYVQHPTAAGVEKYDAKRQRGLSTVLKLKDRLTIIDESLGSLKVSDLTSFVKQKRGRSSKPVVVVVDPYYKLRPDSPDSHGDTAAERVMSELRTLAATEEVAIIATTRLAKGAGLARPTLADIEDQPGVLYDAHVVLLLYCDYVNNGNTPFLEWEWGTDDVMVPIFELNVAKNKMGAFSGRMWYRFFNSFSKFRECPELENDNYNRMLVNLKAHDKNDPERDETDPARIDHIDTSNT